ncbi:hypothetical protein B0H14DRAFT_3170104 [Mycena olivaceomarginata]|nr:hypothetical protein B0H14DRAFT_3170104 [Mycena olivaceomarginata]
MSGSSRARQGEGEEGAYKNERLRLQLGWGKKDPFSRCCDWGRAEHSGNRVRIQRGRGWDEESAHVVPLGPAAPAAAANADNERLKGKGEPGRTLTRARPAMGYVRAGGGKRVSFDAAADGNGGGGVELRAGTKVKFSSRKTPDPSISGFFRLLVLSGCELRRRELDLAAFGLPPLSSLSSTSSSLARRAKRKRIIKTPLNIDVMNVDSLRGYQKSGLPAWWWYRDQEQKVP